MSGSSSGSYLQGTAGSPVNTAALPTWTAPQASSTSNINPASGLVNVPETGDWQLDLNTGAMTPGTLSQQAAIAQRGLPITGTSSALPSAQTAAGSAAGVTSGYNPQTYAASLGYASGGGLGQPAWYTRNEARQVSSPSGLVMSPVGGRTDHIPMAVAPGSYVVPADVVSGIGQGNSMAGGHLLDKALTRGPHGTKLPSGHAHGSIPHPPRQQRFARGGTAVPHGHIPIIVAGGEYICAPDDMDWVGNGDIHKGHDMMDDFVLRVRRELRAKLAKLPGPVKS